MSASSTTPAAAQVYGARGRHPGGHVGPRRRVLRGGTAPPRLARVVGILAALLVAAGCGGSEPATATAAPVLKVAVLQNGDVEDPVELVSSPALAVGLAIEHAEARGELASDSGLWFVETAGEDPDAVVAAAGELAMDPSFVAAVVTPFVDAPAAERVFGEAGIPVFSFSGLGGDQGATTWRRVVPTAAAEAAAFGRLAGDEPCVAGRTATAPPVAGRDVGGPTDAVIAGRDTGCTAVVWLGGADGALAIARGLDAQGSDVPLLVGAAARSVRVATEGSPASVGTTAVVPCRSVDVSTERDARRFVHAYQAAHGVPPGLCAAEGYGLGRWLVAQGTRGAIARALAIGEVIPTPSTPIDLAVVAEADAAVEQIVGVRWLPLGTTDPSAVAP